MRRKFNAAGVMAAAICGSLAIAGSAKAVTFTVDQTALSLAYMNVSDLPADGGAYRFGTSWGIPDLDATFAGPILTLSPNTSIDRDNHTDTYWWKDASGISGPNKNMDANLYNENDALAGQTIEFTGTVLSNTLVAPYTSVAFIKDFAPDYSSSTSSIVALTPGIFDISLATTPGGHIQYGFETIGPDARIATAAALGSVQVTTNPVPEPVSLGLLSVLAAPALLRRRRD